MTVKEFNRYCVNNDCYKTNAKLTSVEYLIVHTPAVYPTIIRGESGSGGGWYKRWNKPGIEKLTHGVIDDIGVYNFAPETMACWQVGNGWGNSHCIGYEFCELNTKEEFNKVWNNGVEKYAELCKKYKLSVDRIVGHCEAHDKGFASNHSDPEPYFRRFGKDMNDFRADVKKKMELPTTSTPTTPSANVKKTYSPWAYARVIGLTKDDPYLNVRSGAGTNYGVIRQLANENEVDVIETYTNGWAKINISGQMGYVYAGYLNITERQQESVKPTYSVWVGKVYNVGSAGLVVRTGPGTGYSRYAAWPKLAEGNLIDIIGESGNWYNVNIAGKHKAWVCKTYVKRA